MVVKKFVGFILLSIVACMLASCSHNVHDEIFAHLDLIVVPTVIRQVHTQKQFIREHLMHGISAILYQPKELHLMCKQIIHCKELL